MIRRLCAALVVIFASSLLAPAYADTKIEKIHQLLEVTGAAARMDQVLDMLWPRIVDVIQKSNPAIKKDVLDSMSAIGRDEFRKSLPDVMVEMEKIYDLNLSDEEVDALLAFYQSPLGKSAMSKMPTIMSQAMSVGQVWGGQVGQKMAARVAEELKKKGYDVHL